MQLTRIALSALILCAALPAFAQEASSTQPPPASTPAAPASAAPVVAPPPPAAAKPNPPSITAVESSEFWRLQAELTNNQLIFEHTPEFEALKDAQKAMTAAQAKAEGTSQGQAFKASQTAAQTDIDHLRQKCAIDPSNPKFVLDQDSTTKALRCIVPPQTSTAKGK